MAARAPVVREKSPLEKRIIFRLFNIWPPFLGSGIRVRRIDVAGGVIEVELRLRWWNRNYHGTQYGGSLFSMTDPFFALLLIERLGPGFVIWDKSASIRFRRPGQTHVRARFEVSEQ
jgi:acyl-coenzyme A thioesterase PaaI-like protein